MRIHVGRPTGRRFAWIALALAVGLTLTAAGALATPGNGHGKGLGKGDTALVAAAKAQGKSTVPLLIATKPGDTAAVAGKLAGFGATVTDQERPVRVPRGRRPDGQGDPGGKDRRDPCRQRRQGGARGGSHAGEGK